MSIRNRVFLVPALAAAVAGCGSGEDRAASVSSSGFNALETMIRSARASDAVSKHAPPDVNEFKRMIESKEQPKEGGAIVLSPSATREKAMTYGWNVFFPAYCAGWRVNGVFYLTMYMTDGSYIYSPDPGVIGAMSPACTTAPAIAVNITSIVGQAAFWDYFVVYHL